MPLTFAHWVCVVALLTLAPGVASATTTITFSGLANGEIVDVDFAGLGLDSITTTNTGGGPDFGIIFDSTVPSFDDGDLEGPPWSVGNLAPATVLGNILIIQENSTGCGDDICDIPDDEASRPAGDFDLSFATTPITSFGWDMVDVENTFDENGSIVFHDGLSTFTITWDDLELGGAFAVAGLVFGNNSANRIPEITAASVGLSQFDRIVINMGGSGGIDNLVIPEPGTGLLVLAGGVLGLIARRRR